MSVKKAFSDSGTTKDKKQMQNDRSLIVSVLTSSHAKGKPFPTLQTLIYAIRFLKKSEGKIYTGQFQLEQDL